MSVIERLGHGGLVPVVEIGDPGLAVPLGDALVDGGLGCAEITFRTSAAAAAIRALRLGRPDVLVGAGTVLTVEQVDAAADAGAAFIVAPGFSPGVVDRALGLGLPVIPGVCTPTEIELALSHGVDVLKFFPAEAAGGVAFLKAVAAPYRSVRFVPTGGIGPENVARYLAIPQVLACGGSWMVAKDLVAAGDFATIRRLTAEAVALVRAARPASAAI
jgi:2-dehydro-3-deoxyphosphogluconate aldolase/(4S)-4-hydroxy-2-oxoglutarate aldolase